MKTAAFIIGLLSFSLAHASESLNLLSMNVYMLPKPIKWTMQSERTNALINQLSTTAYDIVLFQEAFVAEFRDDLAHKLKAHYPYVHYLDRDNNWLHIFGSGLFVMSRHPFKILSSAYFSQCEGFDCFASKGTFLLQLTLPDGKTFQVANTHLQAGAENGSIRLEQLKAIKALLNQFKIEGVSQLLVGDLNIDYYDPEYIAGLAMLQMNFSPLAGLIKTTNARTNDCYSTPEKKLWIDHVWFDRSLLPTRPEIEVRDFSFDFENKKCPSSDHHGVELKYAAKVIVQ